MTKLISIIIATYNSELTLAKCLDSIVTQKCNLVELIIVDGGSVDHTLEVLKRFENDIDNLVSEPDEGIYDAWNKGIDLASGKWFMFVGSDDQLRDGCIKGYKAQIFEDGDYDFISGRIMLVNNVGDDLREFGQPYNWERFKKNMNLAHVSSLHNRSLYERYGNYSSGYKICGDYELLLRPRHNLKVKFVDQLFANMAIGGISFGSQEALREARDIKLLHKVDRPLVIWVVYMLSVVKLSINKTIFRRKFMGVSGL
tara:strand:+ start:2155 stop:2922 length:768 start_codon:yes stop_codon:yes gene_type:complete